MHFPRMARVRVLALLASFVVVVGTASPAAAQDSQELRPPVVEVVYEDGHEHGHEHGAESLDSETAPSFNESDGCTQPAGYRGPYVRQTGVQPPGEPVLGPWGDFFGRDVAEITANRVAMQLPGMNTPKDFWVHERVAPALQQVIDRLDQEAAAGNTYEIRAEHSFSYNPRTIGGRLSLSFHASASAIDINSTTNPYRGDNVLVTDMPAWFVEAWTDAGFCWGGHFQSIKDAMHFSWQGPMETPGYGPTPAPYPPRTAAANFTDLAANENMAFGDHVPGALQFLEDVDRNGAPDVIQVQQLDTAGRVMVTGVRAHQDFETCRLGIVSAVGVMAPGRRVTMGDGDRDGRPDLWSLDETAGTVVASIYSYASGYQRTATRIVTGITPDPDNEYLVGDHDIDGFADLFVVKRTGPGTPIRLQVWDGADDFASTLVDRNVSITADTTDPRWHFALGDRDVDGRNDLFALEAVYPVRASIVFGANNYGGSPTTFTTGAPPTKALRLDVGDYDGDGRDDLYSIRTDGRVRVYLGGVQPAGADLSYWFRDPEPWTPGNNCPTDATLTDTITVPDVTGDGIDEIAALHSRSGREGSRVDVHDRKNDVLVTAFPAPANTTAVDLETLESAGQVLIATLGRDNADGSSVVSIRRADDGTGVAGFRSRGGFTGADLAVGTDGGGAPFVALAEYRLFPLVARVRTFTTAGVLIGTVNFGAVAPIGLEVVPDFTGDGEPEFAVLVTEPGVDAPVTKVRSGTGALLASIKMKAGVTPAALAQIPSFSGGPGAELAVMGEDTERGRTHLIISDGEQKDIVTSITEAADWRSIGIDVMDSYGSTSAHEVALATRRVSDDRISVRVYDAASGTRLLNSKTTDPHRPVTVLVAHRTSGNGAENVLLSRLRNSNPVVLVIERHRSSGSNLGSHVIR